MACGRQRLLKVCFSGAGVGLLLGMGHSLHEVLEGDPLNSALVPAVSVTLHFAVLSLGHGIALRQEWSRHKALGLAIPVSMVFGLLTVVLHPQQATVPIGLLWFWFFVAGFGVLALWFLVFYVPARLREAETRALAADNARRKAELAQLRSYLHPHFLLNTLNAVAGLLVAEPRQARQLVVALGELLRDALEGSGETRPFDHEVKWLRRCAKIFEIRYRGEIRFEWDLSVDTLQVQVPSLIVQPLLENAIKHGALQRPGNGVVTVRSLCTDVANQISVIDNGPGMATEWSTGLGLRLVRDRLRLAHPKARMWIDSTQEGTCVTLELPKTGESR